MSNIRQFERIETDDPRIEELQDKIEEMLRENFNGSSFDSIRRENLVFKSGEAKQISHKLGRSYRGFKVRKLNSDAVIYEDDNNDKKDKYIVLKANKDVTATIEVF